MLKDLIKMGAHIHSRDIVGNSVLHSCAASGCIPAVDVLVKAGLSVNVVNDNGNTPLHDSCNLNQVAVSASFLNHGAR